MWSCFVHHNAGATAKETLCPAHFPLELRELLLKYFPTQFDFQQRVTRGKLKQQETYPSDENSGEGSLSPEKLSKFCFLLQLSANATNAGCLISTDDEGTDPDYEPAGSQQQSDNVPAILQQVSDEQVQQVGSEAVTAMEMDVPMPINRDEIVEVDNSDLWNEFATMFDPEEDNLACVPGKDYDTLWEKESQNR